jgi:hypothetical protein
MKKTSGVCGGMLDLAEKNMLGFTDQPARKDIFGIKKYIEGLSDFISICNMPMTISIQGDWGTGKTSIMEQVSDRLNNRQDCKCIWFNTWQQSQFNMGDELALSLLTSLVEELDPNNQNGGTKAVKTFVDVMKVSGKVLKEIGLCASDYLLGGRAAEDLDKLIGRKDTNTSAAIRNLKSKFQNCINESLQRENRKRVVIFVDDLDRLQPGKAVEVLEVLKLFLDCDRCVFVLAIDYSVVSTGITEKYGSRIGEEKGKSFFDKIIQVPFKVPVAEYNIKNYIIDCFKQIGIVCTDPEAFVYMGLIRTSVGANPRSMKRLFNAYLLLMMVATKEILKSNKCKRILFAVLCMQQTYEKVYNYIVRNRECLTKEELMAFIDNKSRAFESFMDSIGYNEGETQRISVFMNNFIRIVDENGNNEISDSEMESFRNILGFSTITSAVSDTEKTRTIRIGDSVDEIINLTGTEQQIIDVYRELDRRIMDLGNTISKEYTLGQKAVVYFTDTAGGRHRKFCEIAFFKTAIAPFFVVRNHGHGVSLELIDRIRSKINTTNTDKTNRVGSAGCLLKGIKSCENIGEIVHLIKESYDEIRML